VSCAFFWLPKDRKETVLIRLTCKSVRNSLINAF
jgi:hypothetical protein